MSTRIRVHVALDDDTAGRVCALLEAAGAELVDAGRAEVVVAPAGVAMAGPCVAVGEDVALGLRFADDMVVPERIEAELLPRISSLLGRAWRPSVARILRLVAHDLNNPLGAARILAELLHGDLQDPDQRRDAEDLLGAVDHAALQVEMLTHAVRASDPARPWRVETIDLGDAIRKAVRRPGLKGATLCEPLAPASVRVDGESLAGALTELLLHGRRLGAGGERCEISVCANPARVEVRSARANGVGWFPRVLRPDGAASVRETERIPVAALGLSVCSAFAARAGARIEVAEESGTTLTRLVWA